MDLLLKAFCRGRAPDARCQGFFRFELTCFQGVAALEAVRRKFFLQEPLVKVIAEGIRQGEGSPSLYQER